MYENDFNTDNVFQPIHVKLYYSRRLRKISCQKHYGISYLD
jgi:hypothetical protein